MSQKRLLKMRREGGEKEREQVKTWEESTISQEHEWNEDNETME